MQRYIEQLIEEFAKVEANPVSEPDFGESYEEFEKEMLQIEEGRTIPSEQLFNICYEELPLVEKLNTQQIQQLLEAILNALSAKGTDVSIPGNGVPVELVYTEIREMFKEGFFALPGWVIDFCSGWCPECAFADYCDTCKESWTKEELEKERITLNNQDD